MQEADKPLRVVFCTPTVTRPYPAYLDAMEATVPLLEARGFRHRLVLEIGNPYISAARATLLRKALDDRADVVVFVDHDVSWRPEDMIALIEAPEPVVAGTYRFKKADDEYMGALLQQPDGKPVGKVAGETVMLRAERVPAGFLKVTKEAVDTFMSAYPELVYGPRYNPSVDLFNHGAKDGVWWGEDYAFSRNWRAAGGELWVLPELRIDHHGADGAVYPGDFHTYLRRQPGGDLAEAA